ncbi:MAG: phosphoribosylformylglycinamidine synthase I [Bacteroidales bacterium]
MRYGVLKFPGGHGDAELIHILRHHFKKDVREIWYREEKFTDIDALFIGGGFPCVHGKTFEECRDESPALLYMVEFASRGGFVTGFGNGFRLLCEAGLLPGELKRNAGETFICKQVFIKPENHSNPVTIGLQQGDILRNPIATEYGRFVAGEADLVKMREHGQIMFRYCDHEGRISEAINVTGSTDNIAGVCNRKKNVFGMVPRPERAVAIFGKEEDGRLILRSLLDHIVVGSA